MNAINVYPAGFHHIYQTDPQLAARPQIRHSGCFFISILSALALNFHIALTHSEVIEFYDKELTDDDVDVDNEMFVGNGQNLIDDFIRPHKVQYVGQRDIHYIEKPWDLVFGVWHRDGTDFNHFTHGTSRPVAHDPWSKDGSLSVAVGLLISKRIARIL